MSGFPSYQKSLSLLRDFFLEATTGGRIQLMRYGVRRGREEEAMVHWPDVPAGLETSSLPLDAHLSLPLPYWTLRAPG